MIGYLFLAVYTIISYVKLKNRTLLFISLAFIVIALSIVLEFTLLPFIEGLMLEEAYVEAIFEGTQFIAAFFFFYGLRIIKRNKEGAN